MYCLVYKLSRHNSFNLSLTELIYCLQFINLSLFQNYDILIKVNIFVCKTDLLSILIISSISKLTYSVESTILESWQTIVRPEPSLARTMNCISMVWPSTARLLPVKVIGTPPSPGLQSGTIWRYQYWLLDYLSEGSK